jgi:hypothetical protein
MTPMTKLKSQPAAPGATGAADEPESAVQLKRRHSLDPRLDEISAAVRSGRMSLQDGLAQVVVVMGDVAGRVLRPEERLALEHAMRDEIPHYLHSEKPTK